MFGEVDFAGFVFDGPKKQDWDRRRTGRLTEANTCIFYKTDC